MGAEPQILKNSEANVIAYYRRAAGKRISATAAFETLSDEVPLTAGICAIGGKSLRLVSSRRLGPSAPERQGERDARESGRGQPDRVRPLPSGPTSA